MQLILFPLLAVQLAISSAFSSDSHFHSTLTTFISKDGTPIRAEAIGNRNGPHIIFAHGFACTMSAFDPLFTDTSMLSSLYLVRFDTRGHGLSGKPLTPDFYTTDRYADDLKAIIDGFKLVKPFFAGWSLGAAIGADIATNFPHPLPFSGLIWLGGLPYLGIFPKVATPLLSALTPGFVQLNNVTLALSTRIDFAETLSIKTDSVPFAIKSSWVGSTVYLPPVVATLVSSRTQDPTRLFEEGKAGWPLLILHGTDDRLLNGTAVISIMAPMFKNVESHLFHGLGHILFFDDEPTVARHILTFINNVIKTNPYQLRAPNIRQNLIGCEKIRQGIWSHTRHPGLNPTCRIPTALDPVDNLNSFFGGRNTSNDFDWKTFLARFLS